MKVAGRQPLADLVANPSAIVGALLYGSDQGLVRDWASQLARSALGSDGGMFQLIVLPREDHGRLRDELATLPLGGGRRVVRVQDGGDSLAGVLEGVAGRAQDLLLSVEAGTLTPRSKLRSLAERSRDWAAVPCFPEAPATTAVAIKEALNRASLTITPDALAFLTSELGGDFARRQAELEKLTLFAAGSQTVDLAAASACCTGSMDVSLGQAATAALTGDVAGLDRLLDELERDGATGPGLLAVVALELHRILKVRTLMEQGQTAEEACRSILPPIYPRQLPGFLVEVRRWPLARVKWAGEAIRSADASCKRAGSRDFTIAARLLTSLAAPNLI